MTVLGEIVAGGVSDRRAGARGGRADRAVDRAGRAQARRAARRHRARVAGAARAMLRSRSWRCTSASTCSAICRGTTRAAESLLDVAVGNAALVQALIATAGRARHDRRHRLDLVTGAFSYSGSHIAERLLDAGRRVRTLTFHPDRPHPLRDRVEALAVPVRRPGRARAQPRRGEHALQHVLGPLRPRRDAASPRGRELAHAVLRRSAGGSRTDRPPQHHEPVARVAAAVLPRQGARRARRWPRSECRTRSSGRPGSSAATATSSRTTSPGSCAACRCSRSRRRRIRRAARACRRPRAHLHRAVRRAGRRGRRRRRTRDDAVR